MTEKSIRDRINAGEFQATLPYPTAPKEPAVLRKMARDLTPAERESLGKVQDEYDAAKVAFDDALKAYYAQQNDGEARFRAALEEDNGMVGHPKADALYRKAYERGHSGGHGEVTNEYEDLVDLVL